MGNVYASSECTDRIYGRGGQLRQDGTWHYHYDAQGNLVLKTKRRIDPSCGFESVLWHKGDYAYVWQANGMLRSVTRPDGKTVTFKYDALGRRKEKRFDGRIHRYLWDGNVVLHEWEYDETERPQQIVAGNGDVSFDRPEPTDNLVTWIYDTDSYVPTAKLVNGKRYGIVSDYIGRPVQGYDEHGTVVWQADYDIYGNLRNLRGDNQFVPFRQLGQYEDEETGLYYNRFRYYDPNTGGYISQDPIGLAGNNPTLYGYVRDTNICVDRFGLTGNLSFIREALHPATITSENPGGIIKIQATGSHAGDKVAVYEKTKIKDVWSDDYRVHHVSYDPKTNEMTMQIVKKDFHKIGHKGGAKDFKDNTGFKYNTQEAIDEATKRRIINGCK